MSRFCRIVSLWSLLLDAITRFRDVYIWLKSCPLYFTWFDLKIAIIDIQAPKSEVQIQSEVQIHALSGSGGVFKKRPMFGFGVKALFAVRAVESSLKVK